MRWSSFCITFHFCGFLHWNWPHFWGHHRFWGCFHFGDAIIVWGRLDVWSHPHFLGNFLFWGCYLKLLILLIYRELIHQMYSSVVIRCLLRPLDWGDKADRLVHSQIHRDLALNDNFLKISVQLFFFKLQLGALIPRSVGRSDGLLVCRSSKNYKKNYKTLQNLTKHQSINKNDWKRTNLIMQNNAGPEAIMQVLEVIVQASNVKILDQKQ